MSWLLEDVVPNFFINSWELFQSRQSLQEKEVSAVEQNTATADQRYQIYRCHYNEFFQKNAQLCNKASCCIPDLVTPENCSQLDFLFCQQWNRFKYLGQYSRIVLKIFSRFSFGKPFENHSKLSSNISQNILNKFIVGQQKITQTTSLVRLDSGRYATKYQFWESHKNLLQSSS